MGLFDTTYDFDKLVRLTSAGVEVSSFVQVKNALIKRYKEIYGNDIDVDSTSADGQYIMMLALLLYNAYNGLIYLNKNLDPASATGKFLDVLCGLNNVFRRESYNSYAYLYVKYIGTATNYTSNVERQSVQTIRCIDQSGKIWTWTEGQATESFKTKFNANDPEVTILKFVCEESGHVEAYADDTLKSDSLEKKISWDDLNDNNHGDIGSVLDINTYPFEVWQSDDAIVGEFTESDESLRDRLIAERGNSGLTVRNGLLGSLLNIVGVEEANLYNNNTINSITTNDGITVNTHDIYIILRYKENAKVDEELIGNTIDSKLTPGIVTTNYSGDGAFGTSKSCSFNKGTGISYTVYWKKCTPIYPAMHLTFQVNPLLYNAEEKEKTIIKSFQNYLFNLSITDDINIPNILAELNSSDSPVNGQFTYMFYDGVVGTVVNGGKISTGEKTYTSKDTYYNYNDFVNFNNQYIVKEVDPSAFDPTGLYIKNEHSVFEALPSSASYDANTTYYEVNPNFTNTKLFEFAYVQTTGTLEQWTLDIYTINS